MPKITSKEKLSAVAEENAQFIRLLRNTGNASASARLTRRAVETFAGRRRADPEFAARWEAAVVFAQAALAQKGRRPSDAPATVTSGGEFMIGPNQKGELQVRRAKRGSVTARGEEAFLLALGATANIRLAAESVGVEPSAFYKRRAQSPEFARRMQDALAVGYEAVEFALLNSALRTLAPDRPGLAPDGAGLTREAPEPDAPDARMSVDQAMTLIAQRTKTMAIAGRHASSQLHALPSVEESDAALLKRLDMLARKKRRLLELNDGRE